MYLVQIGVVVIVADRNHSELMPLSQNSRVWYGGLRVKTVGYGMDRVLRGQLVYYLFFCAKYNKPKVQRR